MWAAASGGGGGCGGLRRRITKIVVKICGRSFFLFFLCRVRADGHLLNTFEQSVVSKKKLVSAPFLFLLMGVAEFTARRGCPTRRLPHLQPARRQICCDSQTPTTLVKTRLKMQHCYSWNFRVTGALGSSRRRRRADSSDDDEAGGRRSASWFSCRLRVLQSTSPIRDPTKTNETNKQHKSVMSSSIRGYPTTRSKIQDLSLWLPAAAGREDPLGGR